MPFPVSNFIAKYIFDLVHMDIWGPFSTQFVHDYRYFLTMVDDCSQYTCVIMMNNISEVPFHIKNFVRLIVTQFKSKLRAI